MAAYSTRARSGATVSTPLASEELSGTISPSRFTVSNLLTRLQHLGSDPWERIGTVQQSLPHAKVGRNAALSGRSPHTSLMAAAAFNRVRDSEYPLRRRS